MRRILFLAAMTFLCAAPLAAQEAKPGARSSRCADARTQLEMNRCAAREHRSADDDLNRVYGRLMAMADAEARTLLRTAQRAWLPFRDAHCRAEAAEVRGGSMEPMVRSFCLADVTRARTAQLQAQAARMTER